MRRIKQYRSSVAAVITTLLLTTLSPGAEQTSAPLAPTQPPPNIVLILADDVGYGDLSCYGATKIKTPNLDRLAAGGRSFTDAHSGSAVCSPSRYGLLTGQYAFRVNNYAPLQLNDSALIDAKRLTVPGLLKQHGYATACIGKWHLGFGEKHPDWNGELKPGPLEAGFDYYFGYPTASCIPPFVLIENHYVLGLDPKDPFVMGGMSPSRPYPEKFLHGIHGAKAAHALYKDDELSSTLTQKSIDWIHQHRDGPFFLYLATNNIHHPFTPAPRFIGTSGCGLYGDFMQELDWNVGQVLKTLDDLNLSDHTMVIFASDNGAMLNEGGKAAWAAGQRINGNLLGFKFGAWEGGHRVPTIVRWPGHTPPGSVSTQMISNVDLLATFAALLKHPLKGDEGPDSFNMLPALTGNPPLPIRDHVIVAAYDRRHLAIRRDNWIYIDAQGSGGFDNGLKELAYTHEVNSDITLDGKIRPEAPPGQLYDLAADLSQRTNVYRQHLDIVAQLKQLLNQYTREGRSAPRRE